MFIGSITRKTYMIPNKQGYNFIGFQPGLSNSYQTGLSNGLQTGLTHVFLNKQGLSNGFLANSVTKCFFNHNSINKRLDEKHD